MTEVLRTPEERFMDLPDFPYDGKPLLPARLAPPPYSTRLEGRPERERWRAGMAIMAFPNQMVLF